MDNPGLPAELWKILDGKLWHATSPESFASILVDREIRIFYDRYKGSLSKAHGAVSLFDFGPSATDNSGQFNNWVGWMGHQQKSRYAVWLEINRAAVSANLSDAAETRALWCADYSKQIIPGVEACHRGPIPVDAIVSVLLIDQHYGHEAFHHSAMAEDSLARELPRFESGLRSAPPESDLLKAIMAAEAARDKLKR